MSPLTAELRQNGNGELPRSLEQVVFLQLLRAVWLLRERDPPQPQLPSAWNAQLPRTLGKTLENSRRLTPTATSAATAAVEHRKF